MPGLPLLRFLLHVTSSSVGQPSTISGLTPRHDPNSIDFALMTKVRRRERLERVSVICAGVIVTVMVAAFYRILSS